MSAVLLVKNEDGKLQGYGEKGARAWAKFLRFVEQLEIGELLRFEWHAPRSPRHHRYFFAKLRGLFERQEVFDDEDKLRMWLTVGAGYCDLVPGPANVLVAIPQSIAFHKLDEVHFSELHRQVDAFMWSERARRYMWPHLTDAQTYEQIERLNLEFGT